MIIFEFVFKRSDNTPMAFCYFLAFIVFFAVAWRNKDVYNTPFRIHSGVSYHGGYRSPFRLCMAQQETIPIFNGLDI